MGSVRRPEGERPRPPRHPSGSRIVYSGERLIDFMEDIVRTLAAPLPGGPLPGGPPPGALLPGALLPRVLRTSRSAALIAALALALALPSSPGTAGLHAQEFGLAFGQGTSGYPEFGDPGAVAAHVSVPIGFIRLTTAYRRSWDGDSRPGTVCDEYWPVNAGCVDEGVRYDHRIDQWELGLGLGGGITGTIELRGHLSAVRSTLHASAAGAESGRSAGAFYPDGAEWGRALSASVTWTPFLERHLGVLARVRNEALDLEGCVTDTGTPFCEGKTVTSLELGVVFKR